MFEKLVMPAKAGIQWACTVVPLDAFRVRHMAPTWGGEPMDYSDGQPTDPILLHRAGLTAPA